VAYENDWLVVWHDEVTRPDGASGIYGVVHPRAIAVGVVAVDASGRVLLVGQYRYPLERESWELPEGGATPDEGPLAGAQRELAEETGYRAAAWQETCRLHLSNSLTDEAGVLYRASGLTPGPTARDGTEILETRWAALPEALAMIERGEITDAMTIIGLQALALETTGAGSSGPGSAR
jgi:8-oxo-dGTP pyrophosphatase MutT (NUDIX family)